MERIAKREGLRRWLVLTALVVMLCSIMGCVADVLNAAVAYEQKGNYTEAAAQYRMAADNREWRHPVGHYNYARLLEQGLGVPQDLAEAQRRYDAAAGASSKEWPEWTEQDRQNAREGSQRVAQLLAGAPAQAVPPPPPSEVSSPPPSPSPPAPAPRRGKKRPATPKASSAELPSAASPAPLRRPSTLAPPASAAQPRRALVIGNAAYPASPLRNSLNDASDMASLLRRLGFTVTLLRDADQRTIEEAIQTFTSTAPRGSVGLFYFSGHGVQLEGQNYLLPLGGVFREPADVKYRAVAANWVLERMENAGMEAKLLILDACRNNPFGRSWTRSLTRGLAPMETVTGALIAYGTSPGKVALEGTGRNSPYTKWLLQQMAIPGQSVEQMFKAVRVAVQQETRGEQTPWEASSLIGDLYFGGR